MMIPLPHGLGQLHRRNWIVVASWPGTAWWYGTESLCIPNRHDTGSTSPRSVGEVALVPGERGVLLCVALDQRVAKIILDYAEASFERSPILKQLIASRTADALELTNGITLEVRPASFRKLRGPTYVAVIADELAFWYVDTAYANPDVEILNAVEPGLATTGGPLILASSPHARRGVLWDVFRRHYGAGGDPLILVAHAPSRTLNPSLPQRVVDRALEKDRTRATAEYLAEFRTDVEGFVALEVVESCVGDHREMLPATGVTYRAFVDPSGGSEDAMTLAIAHGSTRPDERVIVERHRVDQPTISGRSRANLGHYKPLFACDDCTFSSGRRCAFFTGESTSRKIALSRFQCSIQISYYFASCHQINDRHRRGRPWCGRVVVGVGVAAKDASRQPANTPSQIL